MAVYERVCACFPGFPCFPLFFILLFEIIFPVTTDVFCDGGDAGPPRSDVQAIFFPFFTLWRGCFPRLHLSPFSAKIGVRGRKKGYFFPLKLLIFNKFLAMFELGKFARRRWQVIPRIAFAEI